jgi:protease-4
MTYLLLAIARNLFVLLWRLAIWPLWLLWFRKPVVVRIDLPHSMPLRPPGRLARMLGRTGPDLESTLAILDVVRRDRAFSGVLVTLPVMGMGRSVVSDLRASLASVVEAGKAVTVVLREGGGTRELGLAPRGARVFLHPSAVLRLEGLSALPVSVAALLRRLGLRADLEAVGDYKTAPEMFTLEGISDRHREQITALLRDLDTSLVMDLAEGRGASVESVRTWIGRQVFTAEEAASEGVVDGAQFDEDLEAGLEREARVARSGDLIVRARQRWRLAPMRRPVRVGVIPIHGQILGQASGPHLSGAAFASRIVPAIDRASRDPSLKAIVLDIDSRGGSATASDAIYRQARKAAGLKPVVARVRDVAASGGYYIAAASHEIVANPEAIVGSIGVFGGKLAVDGMAGALGVAMERITLGDRGAGLMLPDRPFDDDERELVRKEMVAFYETFLGIVADRKGRQRHEVEPVAGGRVFTARRALEMDLVDTLGTREDLIASLAARIGCSPARIVLEHLGDGIPVRIAGSTGWLGDHVASAARTARLLAAERMAAEMEFDLIMGSP